MKWLHTYMKEGRFRFIEALILSVILLCFLYGIKIEKHHIQLISKFFNVSAAVVTASGVVAYNLRNRVVDFSKYLISQSQEFEKVSIKTKNTCRRLTFIVFFSIISGVLCMISGIYENVHVMATAGIAFIFSIVWYSHIIFAFDELEDRMLDTALKNRQCEERQKRKQLMEKSLHDHPDNF